MSIPSSIPAASILDVRETPCADKHPLIFSRYDALPEGGSFVLCNSHDPQPLRGKFEGLFPGGFTWEYLQEGPDWLIRITKLRDQGPSGLAGAEPCGCDH
ncbi:MAG: DUF2249 domain-containing protein [Chthoniobacteraceae bacterium]